LLAQGEFLLLNFSHTLARDVVTGSEDETEDGGNFVRVFIGKGEFERALLKETRALECRDRARFRDMWR